MALIAPDSGTSDKVLRELLAEHMEGVESLAKSLETPRGKVLDPARLALARDLAADVTHVIGPLDVLTDRETLRRRVNLSYEAMLVLIDYLKLFTDVPRVPQAK